MTLVIRLELLEGFALFVGDNPGHVFFQPFRIRGLKLLQQFLTCLIGLDLPEGLTLFVGDNPDDVVLEPLLVSGVLRPRRRRGSLIRWCLCEQHLWMPFRSHLGSGNHNMGFRDVGERRGRAFGGSAG